MCTLSIDDPYLLVAYAIAYVSDSQNSKFRLIQKKLFGFTSSN